MTSYEADHRSLLQKLEPLLADYRELEAARAAERPDFDEIARLVRAVQSGMIRVLEKISLALLAPDYHP